MAVTHSTRARRADLTGKRFTRLVVLGPTETVRNRERPWRCQCDCGAITEVRHRNLLIGMSKSCGCLKRELALRHGMSRTKTYRIWIAMLHRCETATYKHFEDYGGRGIVVCERWHDFERFHDDMGDAPKGMLLDRVDNDGPYEKRNCRWATPSQSQDNRRNTVWIEARGERRTAAEWARITGIDQATIYSRIKSGWTPERAISDPTDPSHRHPRRS